jgi:hypothetical protein
MVISDVVMPGMSGYDFELEFQGGAATKPEAEYGNDGGKNRDHARDGRAAAQKCSTFLEPNGARWARTCGSAMRATRWGEVHWDTAPGLRESAGRDG